MSRRYLPFNILFEPICTGIFFMIEWKFLTFLTGIGDNSLRQQKKKIAENTTQHPLVKPHFGCFKSLFHL